MTHKLTCLLMIIALCFGSHVSARQKAAQNQTKTTQPQTKPSEQEQIKVNTDLIQVRAVVTDKQGQIVRGLKQEDFELLENNKPQEVSFFSVIDQDSPSALNQTADAVAGEHPKTSRERLSEKPARTVVLFVDNLHLSAVSLGQVKQALRRFIDEQLTEEDLVALVCSTGTTGLVEQFTRNRQVLRYAIERINPGPTTVPDKLFTPYLAAQIARFDRDATDVAINIMKQEGSINDLLPYNMQVDVVRGQANGIIVDALYQRRATLLTLKALAERMATLPGQRLITIFSDGFTLYDDMGTMDTGDLQATVNRAMRFGVTIYAIDAKGLETPAFFNAFLRGNLPDMRLHSYQLSAQRDLEHGLNALAKDTGGEAFFHTNDMVGALKRALDLNRSYYVLFYYPPDEYKPKQFRSLTVRVKNHPEYTIRTPKGYLPLDMAKARQEEAMATPQQRLMQAMRAPLHQNEIVVSATADFLESDLDDAQVTLRVNIAGDRLTYPKQEEKHTLGLELVMLIYDANGQRLDGKSVTLQGKIKPENLDLLKQNGYSYFRRVAIKPGLYQARVGVRELNTELIGTTTAWIEVPSMTKFKLTLSSLILLDTPTSAAPDSPEAQGSAPASAKVVEGIRFYAHNQPCAYFFRIYQPPGMSDEGLVMQTEIIQDGKSITQSAWGPVSACQIGKDKKGIAIGAQIGLKGLKSGIYELRMTVKDPQSKRTVQRIAPFGVE